MAFSPGRRAFVVDVKGLHKRNFWVVREKPERLDAFYVFALVLNDVGNRFFILSQSEVNLGIQTDFARARSAAIAKGRTIDAIERFPGVTFGYAETFENRWDKLPD
jgi:hypothetical protein